MKPVYIVLTLVIIIGLSSYMLSSTNELAEMPGGISDYSNPKAPKTIKSKDIKSFSSSFRYADEPQVFTYFDFSAEKQDNGRVELTWEDYGEELIAEVGPEFLQSLQDIIDKHGLAGYNGINRVTSGLPYEFGPCHMHAEYESGESINFYMDGEPYSEWMGDFIELFLPEFPGQDKKLNLHSGLPISRFYYNHGGMALPQLYNFELEKEGDDYSLRAEFFDYEHFYGDVEFVLEGKEYKDTLEYIYSRVVDICDTCEIYSWDGFDESDNSVRDGTMFQVFIDFENGEYISAYGNNAFPDSFFLAEEEFENLLEEIKAFHRELNPPVVKSGIYLNKAKPVEGYLFFDTADRSWRSSPSLAMSYSIGGSFKVEGNRIRLSSEDKSVELVFEAREKDCLELVSLACEKEDLKDWWQEGDSYTFMPDESVPGLAEGRACSADEALALAKEEGLVVFEDFLLTAGGEAWEEFCEKVNRGEAAGVFSAFYYTLDEELVDPVVYEMEKDNYPQLYINKLEYEEDVFTIAVRESRESEYEEEQSYQYLKHYTEEMEWEGSVFSYEYYILVNDDGVSLEDIRQSLASSQSGDRIPHFMVYCDLLD